MAYFYVFHNLSVYPKRMGVFLCHFSWKTVFRARFWAGNQVLESFSWSQLLCTSVTPLNMMCLYVFHHLSADPKRLGRFLCHFSWKTIFRARFWARHRVLGSLSGSQMTCMCMTPLNMTCLYDLHHLSAVILATKLYFGPEIARRSWISGYLYADNGPKFFRKHLLSFLAHSQYISDGLLINYIKFPFKWHATWGI